MKRDRSKLLGRIIEKYGSRRAYAEKLGINEATLSIKLDGSDFKESEIRASMALLDIPISEIGFYFFT